MDQKQTFDNRCQEFVQQQLLQLQQGQNEEEVETRQQISRPQHELSSSTSTYDVLPTRLPPLQLLPPRLVQLTSSRHNNERQSPQGSTLSYSSNNPLSFLASAASPPEDNSSQFEPLPFREEPASDTAKRYLPPHHHQHHQSLSAPLSHFLDSPGAFTEPNNLPVLNASDHSHREAPARTHSFDIMPPPPPPPPPLQLPQSSRNSPRRVLTEKERFVIFVKILLKSLDQSDDPRLKTIAKATILECTRRNRVGDPSYIPLQEAIERCLRQRLGDSQWTRVTHLYRRYFERQETDSIRLAAV